MQGTALLTLLLETWCHRYAYTPDQGSTPVLTPPQSLLCTAFGRKLLKCGSMVSSMAAPGSWLHISKSDKDCATDERTESEFSSAVHLDLAAKSSSWACSSFLGCNSVQARLCVLQQHINVQIINLAHSCSTISLLSLLENPAVSKLFVCRTCFFVQELSTSNETIGLRPGSVSRKIHNAANPAASTMHAPSIISTALSPDCSTHSNTYPPASHSYRSHAWLLRQFRGAKGKRKSAFDKTPCSPFDASDTDFPVSPPAPTTQQPETIAHG
jgi:hypothetical protein